MTFIPSLQSISPFTFLKPPLRAADQHFPFNQQRAYYFYFARNGIYFLGRLLAEQGIKKIMFPAYNHGNEIRALLSAGVKLDYYNINSDTTIDFDDVEEKIKQGVRVLYFIHYVGLPQDIDRILELRDRYDLILIEDNALGLFSRYKDKPLGSFGDFSIFCLYKTLPIPNGGLLLINTDKFDFTVNLTPPQILSTLSRSTGQLFFWADLKFNGLGRKLQNIKSSMGKLAGKIDVETTPVLDSNFDTQKANWGISGLSHFLRRRSNYQYITERRRANYLYMQANIPEEYRLYENLPDQAVPWFFPVKLSNREAVFRVLTQAGVDCARFWRISHPDIPAQNFPVVNRLRETILELPIHQDLGEKHLDYIINQFNNALV